MHVQVMDEKWILNVRFNLGFVPEVQQGRYLQMVLLVNEDSCLCVPLLQYSMIGLLRGVTHFQIATAQRKAAY